MTTKLVAQTMKWLLLPYRRQFLAELKAPAQKQARLLQTIVQKLSNTEYGRLFNVKPGDDYAAFAQKVPLINYDKVRHWIERQRMTERGILVDEPIIFYERTSGSCGPEKFIPYTKSLKQSFYRMFAISFSDILWSKTRLSKGKTFASISPQFADIERTPKGKPIGLEDDTGYLHGALKTIVRRYSAVPSSIKRLQDPEDFKRVLTTLLVAEQNLEIVSIWNPTFLEMVLEYIDTHKSELAADLQQGRITRQRKEFRFDKSSAERIDLLMQSPTPWQALWPHLKLISCWTSAYATQPAQRIQALFPDVLLQSKGLLSTEAPMTLSLLDAKGFLPLVSEVFFEFLDDKGGVHLLQDLEVGQEYEIVITQQGGLYRYRVGDRIKVTHTYINTPCLEFVGRADAVCDIVGEKLNEIFVRTCLEKTLASEATFTMLLPAFNAGKQPHYCLVVDRATASAHEVSLRVDEALSKAFHYRNARKLGQLEPLRVLIHPEAKEIYYRCLNAQGLKLGDIKPSALLKNTAHAKEYLSALTVS